MECIIEDHIKRLCNELENEKTFSHPELYLISENKHDYIWWSRRYQLLRQDTSFFKNLVSLFTLRWKCTSIDEWHMKLDMHLVPQEIADFEITYCYMNPSRWYSRDWRLEDNDVIPTFMMNEWMSWSIVDDRFTEISSKHLPICSVDDFINFKLPL